jgi:cell wall-associated NlpC family hydrolase
MSLNEDISKEARNWIDVKYEHRGATKKGCDCVGLLVGVLKALGYGKDYIVKKYPNDWSLHGQAGNYIVEELESVADKIIGATIGDIVLFKFSKCVAHIGILIENGLFIHTHSKGGKCKVSKIDNSPWTRYIDCYYRVNAERLNRLWPLTGKN